MPDRLTQRQNEAYEYIRRFMRERRKPPTLKEIGDALGISSTNGVYKLLQALEKKGYIEREKHAARGIRLLEDDVDPFALDGGAPSLPVISRTASDQPERLRERPRGYLSVDDRLLRRASDPDACLVTRAGDDGMNGDGIQKGDYLVVEEVDWGQIDNGALAAFLVREQVQARRFHFANGRLHLRPADRHYTEETFPPKAPGCYVIGPVLTIIRSL
jgi:repressor LexA